MNFEECIKKKKVVKKSEEPSVAQGLLNLAEVRFNEIKNLKNSTLKVESYYEVIKEILTALLSKKGYKSYSHECLLVFARENYSNVFSNFEFHLIDQLRMMRNDIVYRGNFIEDDFLKRNKDYIEEIILKLKKVLNE